MRRLPFLSFLLAIAAAALLVAQDVRLPNRADSVRFAVFGDNGTGEREQYEVARQMAAVRARFAFEFVLMCGDNMYGGQNPSDFVQKFEAPYKALLDAAVLFYGALGNHDKPTNRFYERWNMNGQPYYTFTRKNVRFFALDSNAVDQKEIAWLEGELSRAREEWKIAFFHHPLYSSGRTHGSQVDVRVLFEPLFLKYGLNVVFAGHDHFYERIKPQKGIYYFISGGAAKLRKGNIKKTDLTAAGYDRDRSFMLVEVAGDDLYFQTVSRTGDTVDSGVIRRTMNTDPREQSLPSSADSGMVQSASF
jgi:hypothetical protein